MNLAAIERLIENGESEKVEFKKSADQLSQAGEALCAFLNDDGGKVIVGYLEPLLGAGFLEMTIPDEPRSSRQRYRTTAAGVRFIKESSAS